MRRPPGGYAAPHPALRATFPSRGRLLEMSPFAFPFRGRWQPKGLTEEVVAPTPYCLLPNPFNQIISTVTSPGLMPGMRLACPREAGLLASSFCRASMRSPAMLR